MPKAYELKQRDRSDKIALRTWTFGFWRQETVLDLYAGEGNLTKAYFEAGCERIVCVEKNLEVFKKLKQNVGEFPKRPVIPIDFHNMDNLDFLENVSELKNVSFVDFDAYGCPNQQIAKFFENYTVDRAIMVNATDGVLLNLSRLATIDLQKYYLVDLYPKGKLPQKLWESKRSLNRLLPWLQETFIHLLATKQGFNTLFLYHAMNREANATYYAFIAYPEHKTSLWATGKTPIIKFKKDRETMIKTIRRMEK